MERRIRAKLERLAVAYFSDRLAALVEPVYFIAFSLATFTEVAGAAWEARTSTAPQHC